MTWLSFISSLIGAVIAIIQGLERRGLIEAAVAQASLKGLRESDEAIKLAQTARQAVRDSIAANPDSVHDNDGFRRD